MAKTGYVSIPAGMESDYSSALQSGDRFNIPNVKVKRLFTSRRNKKGLTQKSLMISLASTWAGFSDAVKNSWNSAGLQCGMTGWRLFIQDTSHRISNGISGFATPSDLHQSLCGEIKIISPAVGLKIYQEHPQSYYVYKKVVGTRSQYEPKLITEDITLPIDITISYKSDLLSAGASPRARFFIIVYSNYQGLTKENVCEINFSLSHDWEKLTASISGVIGQFRGYTAFIEVYNCTGILLFDNVEIVHGGLNWARDPFCNNISQEFTKAFQQIPAHWTPETISDGAFYHSNYPDAV